MNIVETDRITDAVMLFGSAITDIRAFTAPSGDVSLYVTSGTGGGQTRFSVDALGTLTLEQELAHSNGIAAGETASLDKIEIGGQTILMLEGAAMGGVPGYTLGNDGSYDASAPFTGISSALVGVSAVSVAGNDFVLAGQSAGFTSYARAPDGTLTVQDQLIDTDQTALADIVDSVAYTSNGAAYVAVISRTEHTVSVFAVSGSGEFTSVGDIGASDGIGMSGLSKIEVAEVLGETFLVAASSGSSAISVLRITDTGAPAIADHVNDSLLTRFDDVTNMSLLTHQGHTFIVATGSDDGFSLLSLLPNGRLIHRASIEDSQTNALAGASAAGLWVAGDTLFIAAAGQSDAGLSQFEVDLSNLGD
ncbi:MAG: hypothetical protein AAFN59_07440, partial [Pseudomonadota bacterium]